jgi:plasmid replication initiation protein
LFTETEVIETHSNNLVTKSNMLIEANYKLGVLEQKIILCLASNINPSDSDFKTYTLPIKEFTHLLGLKGKPKYGELRQITKEMMKKVFEVRIDKKVIQVSWLSYVAYNETEGTIDIRFDPFLRPYLLELKKEFTSYRLENVVKLKSSYSIRLYELLKQYEKLQERTFDLQTLRRMLGAEAIYSAYGNFKQRVIVPAQKELKKRTDISFEIEEIKAGRKVDKVKFLISSSSKQSQSKHLELFYENLEEFKLPNSFAEKAKRLGLKLGIQLSDDMILSWEKYGQDTVIELLEKMQDRKDITNPVGYIIKVLTHSGAYETAAMSENESMIAHLVSELRQSKEILPAWMVKGKSMEMLKDWLAIDDDEALLKFEELKPKLYEVLNITEPEIKKRTKEEIEELKRSVWESLEKLNN